MTHPKSDNAPPRNCLIHGSAWCTCNPNTSAPSPNDQYVASLPDWVKGSTVNRREPDAPTPTGPVLSAPVKRLSAENTALRDLLAQRDKRVEEYHRSLVNENIKRLDFAERLKTFLCPRVDNEVICRHTHCRDHWAAIDAAMKEPK